MRPPLYRVAPGCAQGKIALSRTARASSRERIAREQPVSETRSPYVTRATRRLVPATGDRSSHCALRRGKPYSMDGAGRGFDPRCSRFLRKHARDQPFPGACLGRDKGDPRGRRRLLSPIDAEELSQASRCPGQWVPDLLSRSPACSYTHQRERPILRAISCASTSPSGCSGAGPPSRSASCSRVKPSPSRAARSSAGRACRPAVGRVRQSADRRPRNARANCLGWDHFSRLGRRSRCSKMSDVAVMVRCLGGGGGMPSNRPRERAAGVTCSARRTPPPAPRPG